MSIHVALCAAMHEATDHLLETLRATINDSKDATLRTANPIRVYRSMHEDKELKKSKGDAKITAANVITGTDADNAEAAAEAMLLPILQEAQI